LEGADDPEIMHSTLALFKDLPVSCATMMPNSTSTASKQAEQIVRMGWLESPLRS
jgi:hypothetical protein